MEAAMANSTDNAEIVIAEESNCADENGVVALPVQTSQAEKKFGKCDESYSISGTEQGDAVILEDEACVRDENDGTFSSTPSKASTVLRAPVGMPVLRSLPVMGAHDEDKDNVLAGTAAKPSEKGVFLYGSGSESKRTSLTRTDPTKDRSRCRCCSYRVFKIILLSVLVAFLLLFVVLFVGSRVERRRMKKAPSTIGFYTTSTVCALVFASNSTNSTTDALSGPNATDPNLNGRILRSLSRRHLQPGSPEEGVQALTMPSIENATDRAAEYAHENKTLLVAHCGDCGQCSNAHDIGIYNATKNNLTDSAKRCGARSLIYGRRTAWRCLDREVGFTPGCNDCWVENIMCDLRRCFFLCTWNAIFGHSKTDEHGRHILNPCTECDEKRCGPDFIRCAGANRRRSAIVSDIDRDEDSEVCKVAASPGWWDDIALS